MASHYRTTPSSFGDEIDTPALLVDRARLKGNIERFAQIARSSRVAIRPHVKTHKTIEIARLQLAAGATGITVAKLSEADVYANAGFVDVFAAYPVIGQLKWRHAAALAETCRLTVGVDSAVGIEGLGRAAVERGVTIGVRVEFDSGLHRSGIQPHQLSDMCRVVLAQPGVELDGIFTFRSSAYDGSRALSAYESGMAEGAQMVEIAEQLRSEGIPVNEVSGGSTPTGEAVAQVPGVTEIRPGTYVFHDRMTVADGAAWDDVALTVLTTVVSRPSKDVAIVDAGSKTLAGDIWPAAAGLQGYAVVVEGTGYVGWMNEEHGAVQVLDGFNPRVGDLLRLVPNHVCTAVNLSKELVVVDEGSVVDRWHVAAGGCRT